MKIFAAERGRSVLRVPPCSHHQLQNPFVFFGLRLRAVGGRIWRDSGCSAINGPTPNGRGTQQALGRFVWYFVFSKRLLILFHRSNQFDFVHVGCGGSAISQLRTQLGNSQHQEKHWLSRCLQRRGKVKKANLSLNQIFEWLFILAGKRNFESRILR